jgi:cephalosporin hydroxylase
MFWSFFSWKNLCFILLFILFIQSTRRQHTKSIPIVWNNPPIDFQSSTQFSTANVPSDCCETRLLLEKCSTAEFVSMRAKKRIALNKNAIFGQGDRAINLGDNHFVSVDDILYGYDVLFEVDALFSAGSWLGIQFQSSPHDAMVLQQIIWNLKPDLIIDFGTNVGGSALFFASIMSFYSETGRVITIDTKPFTQNWVEQKRLICKDCADPSHNKLWKKYVYFIQGSTTDPNVITKVKQFASNYTTVFLSQDTDHTQNTVYTDLVNYAELVSVNSYFLVQDTKLDRLQNCSTGPLAGVRKFLEYQNKTENNIKYTFQIDRSVEMFYYSQHAHGWLKRIR